METSPHSGEPSQSVSLSLYLPIDIGYGIYILKQLQLQAACIFATDMDY